MAVMPFVLINVTLILWDCKMAFVHDYSDINKRMRRDPKPKENLYCVFCEDTGYEMYSTGHMDPHFRECQICRNPKGKPSP